MSLHFYEVRWETYYVCSLGIQCVANCYQFLRVIDDVLTWSLLIPFASSSVLTYVLEDFQLPDYCSALSFVYDIYYYVINDIYI